ncbi:hypothetical protein NDU88_007845 [Pleurodeles waltl]|uniref:Uncharacterized protein n=1 Tax=Pleurodeles waltl TaxID=8319 RepID=A0AAV7P3B7_PLEWA|nr:hypothetical protein NDU88_007845 [Pleurodeles waltl]
MIGGVVAPSPSCPSLPDLGPTASGQRRGGHCWRGPEGPHRLGSWPAGSSGIGERELVAWVGGRGCTGTPLRREALRESCGASLDAFVPGGLRPGRRKRSHRVKKSGAWSPESRGDTDREKKGAWICIAAALPTGWREPLLLQTDLKEEERKTKITLNINSMELYETEIKSPNPKMIKSNGAGHPPPQSLSPADPVGPRTPVQMSRRFWKAGMLLTFSSMFHHQQEVRKRPSSILNQISLGFMKSSSDEDHKELPDVTGYSQTEKIRSEKTFEEVRESEG